MINKLYQSEIETIQYFLRDINDLERAVEAARSAAEAKDEIAEFLSVVVDALETSIEKAEEAQAVLRLILNIIQETKSHENIYL